MTAPVQVCAACGTINDAAADMLDMLAAAQEQIESQREQIAVLQQELTAKAVRIKRQRADQQRQLREHPRFDDAVRVLDHWRRVCAPEAREVTSGVRLERVMARLNGGYDVPDLMRCADGYALKPYVVSGKRTHEGTKDTWRADAELIYRDAPHVAEGIRIAARGDELRTLMVAAPATDATLRPSSPLSELGRAAVRLAERGVGVFPCHPRAKAPATRHGLLDATTDRDRVRRFWESHPDFNLGLAAGSASQIVVLDVDNDKDGWESLRALEKQHAPLPRTASVVTPRGGQHFYFQHPGTAVQNTTGFPGPGLDIRGDGGYVLAPPSVGANGKAYEVDEQAPLATFPQWLLGLLTRRQANVKLGGGVDWARFVSDGATAGERNHRMTRYVGHLIGHGMDAREAYATAKVLNGNVRPPLMDRELQTIVQSIARRHLRRTM